jgi:hypothetical protein
MGEYRGEEPARQRPVRKLRNLLISGTDRVLARHTAFSTALSRSSVQATAFGGNTRAELAAGFRKHAQFLARNFERNVAEATLTGEQEAFRRKIFERGLHALPDNFRRFNHIAPLIG